MPRITGALALLFPLAAAATPVETCQLQGQITLSDPTVRLRRQRQLRNQ